jgi:hypothetical protein
MLEKLSMSLLSLGGLPTSNQDPAFRFLTVSLIPSTSHEAPSAAFSQTDSRSDRGATGRASIS